MDETEPAFPLHTDINSTHLGAALAAQREIDGLEQTWTLPAAQRCAHCGDFIAGGEGNEHTWFGPIPLPGQDPLSAPRYHLDRDDCRRAGGLPPQVHRSA